MSSVEENFPRGGTQKKGQEGKASRQHTVDQDNLFQTQNEEVTQKRKKKHQDQVKPKKLKSEETVVVKTSPKDFELLTAESLTEGMLLLGCVKESHQLELVIGLPNGLTGFVQVTRICDSYNEILNNQVATDELLEDLNSLSDLFSPGMLVRCAVVSLEKTNTGRRSIQLTVNPKDVNKALNAAALKPGMLLSGCISSVEDHGYIIDIGVPAAKAFLPRQKAQSFLQSNNKGAELKIGQYLNCLIEEVKNNGRIIRISICQSEIVMAIATEKQNWSLSNLLPGLVVKAQVKEVTPSGISLRFLSSFTGIVDFMHMGPLKAINYSPGQMVKACIISNNPASKAIRLSLRPVFLQPGIQLGQLCNDRIGMVVTNAKVKTFLPKTGAIFVLDDGGLGFAHRKHLSDTLTCFKPEMFKPGNEHKCRIIDYSLIDDVAMVSLKQRLIDAPFLRYQDIYPGQVLEGTVLTLKPFGMQVKVTEYIKGLVPSLHLADVPLKQPEKKYSVGASVKCRVLVSNPEARKIVLTLKKTLVNSKLPVLASYEDAKPGLITHGFVVCAREFGCIVKFYNDLKGLVPKNELGLPPLTPPQEAFYEGQVVKVIVLKCEPEQEKVLLSFNLTDNPLAKDSRGEKASKKREVIYEAGQVADVKILKKKEDGLEVTILPNSISAYLPMMHLSDSVSHSKLWCHWLKEDDILHNVVCLHDKGRHITLSRKPAMVLAVQEEHAVKNFSDIQPGLLLTGFVKNIMPYGVFVEFPYGLTGLAPKSAMSDKFVTDTKDHFVIGQTVIAKVTNIDEEKQRILLSMKLSDCSSEDSVSQSFSLLQQYFKELQEIKSILSKRDDSNVAQKLCEIKPGQRLQLVVHEVQADGSAIFSGNCVAGLTVMAAYNHLGGKNIALGEKAKVVVLYIDYLKAKICVSLREELLSPKPKKLTLDSQYEAIVQHVATEHAVASLVGTGQLIAIPVASHFNDTFRFDSEKLKMGQSIRVVLKTVETGGYGILLAVQGAAKRRAVIRSRHDSEALDETLAMVKHSLHMGDVVKGTVKSVKPTHVLVAIDDHLTGSIHASQIVDEVSVGTFPTSLLKVGQKVTARVIGGREIRTHRYLPITHPHFTHTWPELSIRPSELKGESKTVLGPEDGKSEEMLKHFKPGQTVTCFVKKYNTVKKWLEVEVTPDIRGRVHQLLLSLKPKILKKPGNYFKNGQALIATVTGCDTTGTKLFLSLSGVSSLEKGTITLGCIKKVIPHVGLHVTLPFGRTGKVSFFHLSDSYAEQPLEDFIIGNIVRCYVLSDEDNIIKVSLRQSRVSPKSYCKIEDPEIVSLDNIKKDQLVRGYVKSITPSGILFRLSDSVVGCIPLRRISPLVVSDHSLCAKYIYQGQFLTAKVFSINKEENLVELSLLPEDTGNPSIIPESCSGETNTHFKKTRKQKRRNSESEEQLKPAKKRAPCTEDDDSGVEVYCREEEEEEKCERKSKQGKEISRLKVSTSFVWEEGLNVLDATMLKAKEQSSDSEEDDDTETKTKKQTKKKKELERQKAEKELSKLEAALMDPNRQPQTADDFDRLVLSNPDSSILWLQYMAFHLQATEIEKARAVAERALKTISFREEQEKLNVWVALLNLENMYGTEEALMKVFERAIQYNEPLKVFQQLADIYTGSEKYKEADDLYNTILKRFRQEKCVWVKYATFLLKRGLVEAAHRLLPRALKCLPQKEHVDVISKLAQLEFQFGDPEHGKAIFENTLTTYPKRTDIWSVYIDMMIKHGNQKEVREIFERVIHLSLAAKKMKFFFKRYLEYEKKYGTAETVQVVKAAALEYVESKGGLAEH
ncbi:protein RRP5 homolog isoform X1 [Sceloporus undulatus]|uniref:protein RRP5 homolog isoform X1 n=1 Tax=Sceloporus undulatus TaxID=8520 RepID=UPI001C4C9448|nr:protein RRP5 homolog isoform X1 [Sceloporus undulatus]XP_042312709.1 protein RRP5 homolog isoform X1 [Sceloporus undulatus]